MLLTSACSGQQSGFSQATITLEATQPSEVTVDLTPKITQAAEKTIKSTPTGVPSPTLNQTSRTPKKTLTPTPSIRKQCPEILTELPADTNLKGTLVLYSNDMLILLDMDTGATQVINESISAASVSPVRTLGGDQREPVPGRR